MARKYFRNIALFFIIWLAVMVIYAVANRVTDLEYLWKFFLLPALFLGFIAALATTLEHLFKVKKGINWIFLGMAVAIDQGIKVYDLLSGEMDYKHHLRAEPIARYSWHWTRRPITTWANRKFGEIREDLESKTWLRRWAFNRRNMTGQQRSTRMGS